MTPVMPHFTSECLKLLGSIKEIKWPKIDEKNLIQDNVKYVVQINGKTRLIIQEKNNLSKEDLIIIIKQNQKINKYFEKNFKIKKVIFIPNKLINIII